jgi:predicted phosphodiesterase
MKILHIGDTHLTDAALEDLRPCTEHVVKVATEERPDLILHAGDLFDSRQVRVESDCCRYAVDWISRLADIAPLAYCLGTPSHDGRAPEILRNVRAENEIQVFTEPGQVLLDTGGFRALLSVLPAPTKQFWQSEAGIEQTDVEIANALGIILAGFGAKYKEDMDFPFHILLGHWSVRGAAISDTQIMVGREIEVARDQIDLAEPDLVCLGHIHKAQQVGPEMKIFYSGSGHRANFGEMEEKGFWIYELSDFEGRALVEPHWYPVPSRKLVKVELDFANDEGLPVDLPALPDVREWDGNTHVQLVLYVWQDEAEALDREALSALFLRACGSLDLRVIRVPRETVRSQNLLNLRTLPDKVRELAALRNEELPATVLAKARDLESLELDQIMEAARDAIKIPATPAQKEWAKEVA